MPDHAQKLKEQALATFLTDDDPLDPRIMHMTECVGSSVMDKHLPEINREEWILKLKSNPAGLSVHDVLSDRFVFPSTEIQSLPVAQMVEDGKPSDQLMQKLKKLSTSRIDLDENGKYPKKEQIRNLLNSVPSFKDLHR